MRAALRDAEAIVTTWDSPRFGEELLVLAPRLRLVAHCGGEVKGRFARPLFERLTIANAPGPMAPYVAELAVTFLLMAARRVDEYREALRRPSNRVYARPAHARGRGREPARPHRRDPRPRPHRARDGAPAASPSARGCSPTTRTSTPRVARALGVPLVPLRRLLRASEYLVVAAGLTGRDARAPRPHARWACCPTAPPS